MALFKYHYIELDTKRSPRISLQNIVAGETGNRLIITVKNNGETVDMSEKEDGEYIYRVCLVIKSNLGVRRQDSATENSGITFIEAATGDHGKVNILLSKDSFTAGKNRARLEIYSTRSEENDTLIVSAEWTFDAEGADEGDNVGLATPLLVLYEKLAESWAHGGTGKREGEDIDNAMYYKQLAEQAVQGGIIDPTFATWLTAHMSDFLTEIATNTYEWLNENITNPSNPPLDTSLSLANAAAPSYLVGLLMKNTAIKYTRYEQGTIGNSGNEADSTAWTRTSGFISRDSFRYVRKPQGVAITKYYYDSNYNYLANASGSQNADQYTDTFGNDDASFMRIRVRLYNGSTALNTTPEMVLASDFEIATIPSVGKTVDAISGERLYLKDLVLTQSAEYKIMPGLNRRKNMIISIDSMYTQNETTEEPYIHCTRSSKGYDNKLHSYYGSGNYYIGKAGTYTRNQIRIPPFCKTSDFLLLSIVVPDGVTLKIRELSVDYSDAISREECAISLNAHGKNGGGCPANTLAAFEMAARLGYRYCITIPKVTSDGVYVCLHDDDSIQSTARNDDGTQIASEYQDRPVSDFTYSQLLQFDFGIARGIDYAGERIPLLEDFFKVCARTGMHPMLSVHPNLSGHWDSIKSMAKKYGVLKTLNIKSDQQNVEIPMAVLLDEIESYTIDESTATSRVSRFNTLKSRYSITKAKCVLEYNYSTISDSLIADALAAGYYCGCFNYGYANIKPLIEKGVTIFTEDYNASVGLNW